MKKTLKILVIYLFLIVIDNSCAPPEEVIINDITLKSATIKERKEDRAFNNYVGTLLSESLK